MKFTTILPLLAVMLESAAAFATSPEVRVCSSLDRNHANTLAGQQPQNYLTSKPVLSQLFSSTDDDEEELDESMSDDALFSEAVGEDGKLPGGLSPDQMKSLVENPEILELLKSSKMQEAMQLVQTGGPDELAKAIEKDPELAQMLGMLNSIMGGPAPSE